MMQSKVTAPQNNRFFSKLFLVGAAITVLTACAVHYARPTKAASVGTNFNLGTLGGPSSFSNGINDSNQVIGTSDLANNKTHAFYWDSTSGITDLGALPGGTYSLGYGINNSGIMVGASEVGSPGTVHAFVTDSAKNLIDLGGNGESITVAKAINDNGVVAGYTQAANGTQTPFVWDAANGFTNLPAPYVSNGCWPSAINNAGQVVGHCGTSAILWNADNTTYVDMGKLGGTSAAAYDINNLGQVVGRASGGTRAVSIFLWNANTQTETSLNSLQSTVGNTYSSANSINDLGQIAGTFDTSVNGGMDQCGPSHAFIWSAADGFSDVSTDGMQANANTINNSGQVAGYSNPYYCVGGVSPSGVIVGAPTTMSSMTTMSSTTTTSTATTGGNTSLQLASAWSAKKVKPTVMVGSAAVVGADSGWRTIQFPITLSIPSSVPVTVSYQIKADTSGTAVAGTDFVAKTGTVTFTPSTTTGLTPTTIYVATSVSARPAILTARTFSVSVSAPTAGYKISKAIGRGTILNDGLQTKGLRASIGNVNIYEGDHGRNAATVIVNLSKPVPAGKTVGVTLSISGGTAHSGTIAGSDYLPYATRTLTFTEGQFQKAISITELADMITELNENIVLRLSSPTTGLSLGRYSGLATILTDE